MLTRYLNLIRQFSLFNLICTKKERFFTKHVQQNSRSNTPKLFQAWTLLPSRGSCIREWWWWKKPFRVFLSAVSNLMLFAVTRGFFGFEWVTTTGYSFCSLLLKEVGTEILWFVDFDKKQSTVVKKIVVTTVANTFITFTALVIKLYVY